MPKLNPHKFQKPKTENQKEWNKQIDRLTRFGRRHNVTVNLPQKPQRVSKKMLSHLKDLRGKKAFSISTIKTQIPITTKVKTPKTGEIKEQHYEAGQEVPVTEIIKTTGEKGQALQDTLDLLQTPETEMPNFSTAMNNAVRNQLDIYSGEAPVLVNALIRTLSIIERDIGSDGLSEFLGRVSNELGDLDQYMYYGLGRAFGWFRRLNQMIGQAGFQELASEIEAEINRYEEDDTINFEIVDYRSELSQRRGHYSDIGMSVWSQL